MGGAVDVGPRVREPREQCNPSFLIALESATRANASLIEHAGAEWVYCLKGLIEYEVEGRACEPMAGDNLLFDASLPHHRWRNPSPIQARMLLILDIGERHHLTAGKHLRT